MTFKELYLAIGRGKIEVMEQNILGDYGHTMDVFTLDDMDLNGQNQEVKSVLAVGNDVFRVYLEPMPVPTDPGYKDSLVENIATLLFEGVVSPEDTMPTQVEALDSSLKAAGGTWDEVLESWSRSDSDYQYGDQRDYDRMMTINRQILDDLLGMLRMIRR